MVGTSLNINYLSRLKLKVGSLPLNRLFTIILFFGFLGFQSLASAGTEDLKKQLELNPNDLTLRQSLAQSYFDSKEYTLAIEVLKARGEKLPQESLTLLAHSYLKINDTLNEGKFLEQLTANYPTYAAGFVMLGDYHYRSSLVKNDPRFSMNCLAAYRKAIEINSSYRPAYEGLVKAYERYKNFYELRILLGDMAKHFGKTPEILAQLCRRNALDGYFVNARRLCIDAINSDSKNPDNYIYLSLVENNEGNIKKADSLLKKVTAKFPQSEFAQSNYADFLLQQKNLPGAETYFSFGAKADNKSYRAQLGLAQTSFELKHYESALEAYIQACALFPHTTYRLLRKAADLLRHRSENKLEAQYSSVLERCLPSKEDNRAPASSREEYRSPFALYSKNKLPE